MLVGAFVDNRTVPLANAIIKIIAKIFKFDGVCILLSHGNVSGSEPARLPFSFGKAVHDYGRVLV